jgi:hypothetical protein
LWLAVAFHVGCGCSGCGIDAISESRLQSALREEVAARTRATSAGATTGLLFPKLLRTYDATAAIHSSRFVPIGAITPPA